MDAHKEAPGRDFFGTIHPPPIFLLSGAPAVGRPRSPLSNREDRQRRPRILFHSRSRRKLLKPGRSFPPRGQGPPVSSPTGSSLAVGAEGLFPSRGEAACLFFPGDIPDVSPPPPRFWYPSTHEGRFAPLPISIAAVPFLWRARTEGWQAVSFSAGLASAATCVRPSPLFLRSPRLSSDFSFFFFSVLRP